MKDEYVIINKNQILKRIEELENEYSSTKNGWRRLALLDQKRIYNELLSQQTPLQPILEKAYYDGCFTYYREKCEWTNGDEVNYALEAIEKLKI